MRARTRGVGRVLAERLAEGEERELRVLELLLAEVRELEVERLALERVGPLAGAHLEDRRLLGRIAAPRVGALEDRGRARVRRVLLEHRLEPRHRLGVVGARGERPPRRARARPRGRGGASPSAPRAAGEARAAPGRRTAAVGGGDLAGEHVGEVHPALGPHAEAVEARERVAIARNELEEPLEREDRALEIAEPLVLHLRELGEEPRARVGPLLRAERAADRLRERLGVAGAAEGVDEAERRLRSSGARSRTRCQASAARAGSAAASRAMRRWYSARAAGSWARSACSARTAASSSWSPAASP